ncbi:GIY-YIG nuclease family protein [Aerosakkonemataceae cyanobacterium BLCC-F50]|uniref:GIY-YIG nuclease family protein n=1 Tax=Floridaenema flaviceps BLCC-F50 TaxID=3153642 RepID=A0ABV4XIU8_9CYAN
MSFRLTIANCIIAANHFDKAIEQRKAQQIQFPFGVKIMAWSRWFECKFDEQGNLDTSALQKAPSSSGVYAIATKTGWSYNTQYVGRSGRSIRNRLQSHLSGRGNRVISSLLAQKKNRPQDRPDSLYFAFLETREHKLIEATYIDAEDRPVCNLIRASLPEGLREGDVMNSPLED